MRILALLFFLVPLSLAAQTTNTPSTPKAIDARMEELAVLHQTATATKRARTFYDPSEFITNGKGELSVTGGQNLPVYLRVTYTKGGTQVIQEEAWFDGGQPIYYRTIEKVWDDAEDLSRVGTTPPLSENRMTSYLHDGQVISAFVDEQSEGTGLNRAVLPTPYAATGVEFKIDKWVRFLQSNKDLQGFE